MILLSPLHFHIGGMRRLRIINCFRFKVQEGENETISVHKDSMLVN